MAVSFSLVDAHEKGDDQKFVSSFKTRHCVLRALAVKQLFAEIEDAPGLGLLLGGG